MRSLISSLVIALVMTAGLLSATPAAAKEPVYQSFLGTAIDGTDPVAYFTEGRPVEGSSDFTYEWNGATWRFASAENRDTFAAEPEKYAPQYGGYCAWAVAQGYTASTDPEAWKIVDGKLYLNYDKGVQAKWEADIPGFIKSADGNWPKVLE
jgi:YHS domain-containing protein